MDVATQGSHMHFWNLQASYNTALHLVSPLHFMAYPTGGSTEPWGRPRGKAALEVDGDRIKDTILPLPLSCVASPG